MLLGQKVIVGRTVEVLGADEPDAWARAAEWDERAAERERKTVTAKAEQRWLEREREAADLARRERIEAARAEVAREAEARRLEAQRRQEAMFDG